MSVQTDEHTGGHIDRRMTEQTDEHTCGHIDRRITVQTDEHTSGHIDRHMAGEQKDWTINTNMNITLGTLSFTFFISPVV